MNYNFRVEFSLAGSVKFSLHIHQNNAIFTVSIKLTVKVFLEEGLLHSKRNEP